MPRSKNPRARVKMEVASAMLVMLRAGQDVRRRKTRRLRAAVRAGRYENEMKLTIAMEKLLAVIQSERSE